MDILNNRRQSHYWPTILQVLAETSPNPIKLTTFFVAVFFSSPLASYLLCLCHNFKMPYSIVRLFSVLWLADEVVVLFVYWRVYLHTPRRSLITVLNHCAIKNHVNATDGGGSHFLNIPPKQTFDVKYYTFFNVSCLNIGFTSENMPM